MKKLRFAVPLGIIMLAFPVLFIVGITHVDNKPTQKNEVKEIPTVKIEVEARSFECDNPFANRIALN